MLKPRNLYKTKKQKALEGMLNPQAAFGLTIGAFLQKAHSFRNERGGKDYRAFIRNTYHDLFGTSHPAYSNCELLKIAIGYEMKKREGKMLKREHQNWKAIMHYCNTLELKLEDFDERLRVLIKDLEPTEEVEMGTIKKPKKEKKVRKTIKTLVCGILMNNHKSKLSDDEIIKKVRSEFKETECSIACIAYYASKLNNGVYSEFGKPDTNDKRVFRVSNRKPAVKKTPAKKKAKKKVIKKAKKKAA